MKFLIQKSKFVYWFFFNRKRYILHTKCVNAIKYGKCKVNVPVAWLNFTHNYFCMDMIDKGWKKETINIEPRCETTYANGTKEDVNFL